MRLIEREAGAGGLVLRPLSAGLLEPSLAEREGWVDRARMLSIAGRSRKPQIALARELGLNDYPCPAGGCRLTDPGFAGRMKDLLEHEPEIGARDVRLLRWGRHFRLSPKSKAVVGRNEEENGRLAGLAGPDDLIIEPLSARGPTTLVAGSFAGADVDTACAIAASYSTGGAEPIEFEVEGGRTCRRTPLATALARGDLDTMRVRPLRKGWRRESPGVAATGCGARRTESRGRVWLPGRGGRLDDLSRAVPGRGDDRPRGT
jgi:hypothetical protein